MKQMYILIPSLLPVVTNADSWWHNWFRLIIGATVYVSVPFTICSVINTSLVSLHPFQRH